MDIRKSIENRVTWIKNLLTETGAKGVVYGNSGGKDCTLVAALCKSATENVLGVIMPCQSSRNYGNDKTDALLAAERFGIEQTEVDLTRVKEELLSALGGEFAAQTPLDGQVKAAAGNINPRIRMTVLYALGQKKGYLVAGTGNRDEITMGYYTKWGDGGYDFNPIADLNVEEIYEHLRFLDAPKEIINKVPSAGLFEGQTDEAEMGVTYAEIDVYLNGGEISSEARAIIERAKKRNAHKLAPPLKYGV